MNATAVDEFLDIGGLPDAELLVDLLDMIRTADKGEPRSQQVALGPSQVGTRCMRQLAYGLTATSRGNDGSDPWAAIQGKANHEWMKSAARAANRRMGRVRWIPETRVTVRPGLSGTADLYDLDSGSLLDWKFPGASRFAQYRRNGPSHVYRVQAHLYACGFARLGLPVNRVGIVFVPRAGFLRDTHLWAEDYSPELVAETFARIDQTHTLIRDLDVPRHPERYQLIPKTPDEDCRLCPWWSPAPTGPRQCSGLRGQTQQGKPQPGEGES